MSKLVSANWNSHITDISVSIARWRHHRCITLYSSRKTNVPLDLRRREEMWYAYWTSLPTWTKPDNSHDPNKQWPLNWVNSGQDVVQDERISPKGETVNVEDSMDQTFSILSVSNIISDMEECACLSCIDFFLVFSCCPQGKAALQHQLEHNSLSASPRINTIPGPIT